MIRKISFLVLCAIAANFYLNQAHADNQVDKVVYTASSTPASPGHPSVQTTGLTISGSVDFVPAAVNVWFWTGAQWIFGQGYGLSVDYSRADSRLYNKTVYRYYIAASAQGNFPIVAIDVDFFNPATGSWVKMSSTKGFTYLSNNTLWKPSF